MTEIETRLLATEIVDRLRRRRHQPNQIRIFPNGAGVTVRVGFVPDLAVESIIPPGFFDYDRVVDDLAAQIRHAVIDSDS